MNPDVCRALTLAEQIADTLRPHLGHAIPEGAIRMAAEDTRELTLLLEGLSVAGRIEVEADTGRYRCCGGYGEHFLACPNREAVPREVLESARAAIRTARRRAR